MSTGVETDRVREAWPQLYARIAGGLYLIVIVGGIFAEIVVVNKNVALMMVFFGFITNAIESVSLLAHFAPLLLLGSGHHLIAFTAEQLQAASYLSLQMFEHGFAICLVFFGFDCFTMAYLIVHSKFFPRLIGVLLAIEGLGISSTASRSFLRPRCKRGSSLISRLPRSQKWRCACGSW